MGRLPIAIRVERYRRKLESYDLVPVAAPDSLQRSVPVFIPVCLNLWPVKIGLVVRGIGASEARGRRRTPRPRFPSDLKRNLLRESGEKAFEEVGIKLAVDKIGVGEDALVQRKRCLDSLDNEHLEGAAHASQ